LTGETWEPIGTSAVLFKGSLDGDGHKIINLKINRTLDFSGLFGYTQNATIKSIYLENPDVTASGRNYVGALIGYSYMTTVSNCSVVGTGQITGGTSVGGLIGSMSAGIVSECYSDIAVTASSADVGGLIGNASNQGIVEKSYSTGNVSATYYRAGGLVGSGSGVIIRECYATGDVTGKQSVGGLIGYLPSCINLSIEDCMSYGDVTASVKYGGGLIGDAYSIDYQKVKNCYSVGSVTGPGQNGGIIAYPVGVILKNTYYDAAASGYVPKNQGDVAKLTGEMQVKSTFVNWDFENIWTIEESESYPYLRHVKRPDESSGSVGSDEMTGNGTLESPYLIETKAQLNSVRMGLEAHYKLVADIDLTGETWEPIGTSAVLFKGSLDGDGHKIINLKINRTLDFSGLFGYTQNATIKSICLENPDVTASGRNYVGALIGYSYMTTVSNCSVVGTGQVTGGSAVGGLIGYQVAGTVTECHSDVAVTSSSNGAGGLVGSIGSQGIIEKSYCTGNVSSINSTLGGLVGSGSGMIIRECYATGNVIGKQNVGGLIGYSSSSGNLSIENCMSYGDVTASVKYGGGLIGYAYSTDYQKVKNCYSVGSVSGPGQNGGIIAYPAGAIVKDTYYDASASGYVPKNKGDVARQTSEMQMQSTFVNWDFDSIWGIEEGISYPYLRNVAQAMLTPMSLKAKAIETTKVLLDWTDIAGASSYEIELNGSLLTTVNVSEFEHLGLEEGTEYTYRVRAKTGSEYSKWSNSLKVVTKITVPSIESIIPNGSEITVTWTPVLGATGYKLQLDDEIIDVAQGSQHILTGVQTNKQHHIRIKAVTELAESEWSDMASVINWSDDENAICLSTDTVLFKDTSVETLEIKVNIHSLINMYTTYLIMEFDPSVLSIDPESFENTAWKEDTGIYMQKVVEIDGKIRVILSKLGNIQGEQGTYELFKFKTKFLKYQPTTIKVTTSQMVDEEGNATQMNKMQDMMIHIFEQ
ncbi:hypothetical protein QE109_05275, partial [Fusibacter bizertensis]|nr:hypothetical protein [Fusibacter bizertensis]